MNGIKRLIQLELFSAILFTLAIPNQYLKFGSFVLGLLALVPHFIVLEKSKTLGQTIICCFLQSITVHLLSSFWLGNFKDFAIFTLGASALGTGAIHCLFGFFFFLPKTLKSTSLYDESKTCRIINSNTFKVIWFTTVYTIWEFQKSRGFLGYPWGTLPMTCYNLKLIPQIVDTTGVRGITFLFSFFAASIGIFCLDLEKFSGENAFKINKNIFSAILMFFMCATVYGVWQYTMVRIPEKHLNTLLIQQNYNPWIKPDDALNIYESEELTLKGVNDFSKLNKKADLVVWSEGVLHYPFPQAHTNQYYSLFPSKSSINPDLKPLTPFLNEIDAYTIVGSPYCHSMEESKFSNAAILFGRDGQYFDYYAKTHLVPFAEYIPFTNYTIVRKLLNRLIGFSVGWTPGQEFKAFPIELSDYPGQSANISIPICFEDAYADIFAGLKKVGTDVFVNITDDSWSKTDAAEYQHFVISWYRAMEFRTTLLRSTNSGYTIVEDPAGRVLYDLPLYTSTYLACSVPIYKSFLTFYAIFGEWISTLCIIFILITTIFIIRQFLKTYDSLESYILKELYSIKF